MRLTRLSASLAAVAALFLVPLAAVPAGAAAAPAGPVVERAVNDLGTVNWYDTSKGYGFITPDAGGRDVYVHFTAIVGSGYLELIPGERVMYDAVETARGPQAQNVRRL